MADNLATKDSVTSFTGTEPAIEIWGNLIKSTVLQI